MRNLLDELWYDNVSPVEQCTPYDEEMRDLIALVARHRETLDAALNEKEKETLEKFCDCSGELNSKFEVQAFKYGFSIGMRLVIEAYNYSSIM